MRWIHYLVCLIACLPIAHARALAGDWVIVPDGPAYTRELWGGGDATGHSTSVYSGMTYALTGGDIRYDGIRFRSGGGYGLYTYTSPRWNGSTRVPVTFQGTQAYTDLLLGYQKAIGPWVIKLFAGGTHEAHKLAPFDDENSVQGGKLGAKIGLETWVNVAAIGFLQTDTSWSPAFQSYGARVRAGYRLTPALSAGIEAAANGNAAYDAGRVGAFTRFHWSQGELSFSGGTAGDRSGILGAYGSVGMLYRF